MNAKTPSVDCQVQAVPSDRAQSKHRQARIALVGSLRNDRNSLFGCKEDGLLAGELIAMAWAVRVQPDVCGQLRDADPIHPGRAEPPQVLRRNTAPFNQMLLADHQGVVASRVENGWETGRIAVEATCAHFGEAHPNDDLIALNVKGAAADVNRGRVVVKADCG